MATFYNQATLRYGDATVLSNIVTGRIRETLSVSKTAVDDSYRPGDTLTYAVSLVNSGEREQKDLTVTDDLGAYELPGGKTVRPLKYVKGSLLYFRDGVLRPAPKVTDTSPLTITDIDVPENGNVMLLYQAVVTEYAPSCEKARIKNTVTVSGCHLKEPISDTAVVKADDRAVLSISKSLSPQTVTERDRITYTFVIENRGASQACGVVLTDDFDPALKGLKATYNGAPWKEGEQYSYAEATGLFVTKAGAITVPAATFTQDHKTGVWSVVPGTATLVVTGSI